MVTQNNSLVMWQRVVLLILSLAGYALSLFTVIEHFDYQQGGQGMALCSISSLVNCKATLTSPIAEIFGIPLGVFGMIFYGFLSLLIPLSESGAVLLKGDKKATSVDGKTVFFFATLASFFSLALLAYSLIGLGTICPLCAGTYLVNFIMFALLFVSYKASIVTALQEGVKSIVAVLKISPEVSAKSLLSITAITSILLILYSPVSPLLLKWTTPLPKEHGTQAPEHRSDEEILALWKSQAVRELSVRRGALADADFIQGSEFAPVTLVEYSDFECPFCQVFSEELEKILEIYEKQYPNKIRFVFKNFPLDSSCNRAIKGSAHQHACQAAEFARCAGEQGKFQSATKFLFTEALNSRARKEEKITSQEFEAAITDYIKEAGLDAEAINTCRTSDRHMNAIKTDIEEGIKLDLQGTPTVYINGRMLNAESFSELITMLDLALTESLKTQP